MATRSLSGISRLFIEGLTELTPAWVRFAFLAEPRAEILRLDQDTYGVQLLKTTGSKQGGRLVDVVLPKALLLERQITIPPSPPANHPDIAALDLQRRTPFRPSEVVWTLSPGSTAKSTQLTQWVARTADIADFRSSLKSHGYEVRRFFIGAGSQPIPLTDFSKEIAPRAMIWRRMNATFASITLLAVLAIWLMPAIQARPFIAEKEAQIASMRAEALALRSEISDLSAADAARAAFIDSVTRRVRVVNVLRELTVALPDDVWISDIMVTDDTITINGETTGTTADLVLALAEKDLGFVPAMNGPVTRTAEGKERFGIAFTANGAER